MSGALQQRKHQSLMLICSGLKKKTQKKTQQKNPAQKNRLRGERWRGGQEEASSSQSSNFAFSFVRGSTQKAEFPLQYLFCLTPWIKKATDSFVSCPEQ